MSKSPSLRRIQADIRELRIDPSDRYVAAPLEDDMFEWHFTIRGADGTEFEGGIYHGRILVSFSSCTGVSWSSRYASVVLIL
mmetsp:Transcript_12120/g.25095  ORF Transcript_12120/g.25095 Transcript_12120/m.25095 type:complete len:82 (-) Transcript_12120:3094-3339(-)